MISELFHMVDSLSGELFLYLEGGSLKNKLVEGYMAQDDAHGEILEFEHNVSLRIRRDERGPVFECRLEAGSFHTQAIWTAEDLTAENIAELIAYLRPHCSVHPRHVHGPGRNIVRKKQGRGLLNIAEAASALDLSQRSLKSLIPCSDVRIVEDGGDKIIKDYYWDEQLIGRFSSLRQKQTEGRGYNREDLSFVAACCCDGDRRWARDLIVGFLHQRRLCGD